VPAYLLTEQEHGRTIPLSVVWVLCLHRYNAVWRFLQA